MALGRPVPFFQEWLEHCEPDDPYWTERVCADVSTVRAPVCMVGGWYDIFLPWQLRDYATLRGAGAQPRLVIGPWTHADPGLIPASVREGVSWFAAARNGGTTGGVSVHIGGIDEWRDLPSWPPHSRRTPWYLRPGMGLAPEPPTAPPGSEAAPDRFRYDPADPTPSPGGALLTTEAGPKDNRVVERRPDILVYSGEELAEDLEAIGPVTATIRVRTSGEHFDVHVRLCDVHPDGRSVNLTDGIRRVCPGEAPPDSDGVRAVEVELWPIGHVFKRGHRLRVHVAGGAHPRSARNPGTGEPLGSATALRTVDFEVHHDAAHPSALHLPA
jgi:putative CocE/NonD family hydrolase